MSVKKALLSLAVVAACLFPLTSTEAAADANKQVGFGHISMPNDIGNDEFVVKALYFTLKKESKRLKNVVVNYDGQSKKADDYIQLCHVEYDENKNIIGGILGGTYWGWMHIDILWVDNNFRKKRIGSHLLEAAEEEAKKRGCHSVHVDTMSWQAPEFYKKNGYKIISELNNIPIGYKKFHLIKEL